MAGGTLKTHGPRNGETWTVSGGPNLPKVAHAIMLAAAGDVKVRWIGGNIQVLPCAAGVWIPMQIDQIIDAGTDAATVELAYLE